MYFEPIEGFHYVVEDKEQIEREFAPLPDRLKDQNLWQSVDWYHYNAGLRDGSLSLKRSENPFYILGYDKSQEQYRHRQP